MCYQDTADPLAAACRRAFIVIRAESPLASSSSQKFINNRYRTTEAILHLRSKTRTETIQCSPCRVIPMSLFVPLLEFNLGLVD